MSNKLFKFNSDTVYTFIDCETLNLCLHSCHNLPWQIEMIKVKGNKKIDEKNFYIKWDTDLKISHEAARITRYSQSHIDENGIKPEEVFPTIDDWLTNCDYIVGHNVLGFDIYLIKSLYELFEKDYKFIVDKTVDTLSIARGYKFGISYDLDNSFAEYQYKMLHTRKKGVRTNLTALGKEFNLEHNYEMLHNAIVDLELNLKVWNVLKAKTSM